MRKLILLLGAALAFGCNGAFAQSDKVEIEIFNNRQENVVMKFQYAFRDRTWKLIEHTIDAGDDITYRFPANIPGCEYLRDWRITDGVLSIHNASGLVCDKRISLCDRVQMAMDVQPQACYWRQEK